MASGEPAAQSFRFRRALAWLLACATVVAYLLLPDADELRESATERDDGEEIDRPEILSVSPPDPYPGSSVRLTYQGVPPGLRARAYAGKSELERIAERPGELILKLPHDLPPGVLKVRVIAGESRDNLPRSQRSKAFHLRIKLPNYQKVFRSLIGGLALVVLGIRLMARGVRESTGVAAARAVTRAARVRPIAYGFGALTGALVQSTTSAASVLAALSSSGVLPLGPAGLAFLGAQCGAAIAPLLVTGFMAPREGLVAVAIGVLWMGLAVDRRGAALGRLVLGVGFVAYGLQLLRPALEPFVSDPMFVAVADRFRADDAAEVALCALIGAALTALLQGPAALIVLMLAVAQTTGRWDLTTALALLSGTSLGSAVAALLTVSAGVQARLLARLHLILGTLATLFSAATVSLWSGLVASVLREPSAALEGVRAPLAELGAPLALAFALSQFASAFVLALLVPYVAERLARAPEVAPRRANPASPRGPLESALGHIIELQQAGLDALAVLAQTGARGFGQKAEHALHEARAALATLVEEQLQPPSDARESEPSDGAAAFACLQLQHALETLLARAERGTEARLHHIEPGHANAPWDDQVLLRELHELISQGLAAARQSLRTGEPPDLDEARAREIKINRLEQHARRSSRDLAKVSPRIDQQLHMLQVIDAYEVVGNHVYRLNEAMEPSHGAASA